MTAPLLMRLSAHDRALRTRCAISPAAPRASLFAWTAVTHLGGTGPSLLAASLPLLACCMLHQASRLALMTLVVSHLLVQLVKRTFVRDRPAKVEGCVSLVREPDRFSFPSGHAAASMSVALAYGTTFPAWAAPLLLLAAAVGFSRVRLGVHYPSDVLMGQLIAVVTGAMLLLPGWP
jgi:undecaprenyl-diphosphatase